MPETETITDGGWEPAIVINYPVEPSMHDEAVIDSQESEEHSVSPSTPPPSTNCPVPTNLGHRTSQRTWPIGPTKHMSLRSSRCTTWIPPERKSVKRKRASVPSWDEIMFGGPKRQS